MPGLFRKLNPKDPVQLKRLMQEDEPAELLKGVWKQWSEKAVNPEFDIFR